MPSVDLGRLDQAVLPPGLRRTAVEAWLFALPLIEMAAARARMLNPLSPGQCAGLNAFVHTPDLSSPLDRAITMPNNDTLFSNAFVDLREGPVTIGIPHSAARYMSVAVMDMYTDNNVVLGPQTPGGAAGSWRLLGPQHQAAGPRDLVAATPEAWILGRTLVSGQAGALSAARELQRQLTLTGPRVSAPAHYATRDQDWWRYFQSAAALLAANPPRFNAGLAAFEALRTLGRSGDFDPQGYAASDCAVIAEATAFARRIVETASDHLVFDNGWSRAPANLGQYGDDLLLRAVVAVTGLGALPPSEVLYLRAQGDSGHWAFEGAGPFVLRLPGPLPVNGFWSLTLYAATEDGQFFLAPNQAGRYSVGDRSPGLRRGPGGEIELWIAREPMAPDRSANWLPAPRTGRFACCLRAYLPAPEFSSDRYRLPPIVLA